MVIVQENPKSLLMLLQVHFRLESVRLVFPAASHLQNILVGQANRVRFPAAQWLCNSCA